MTHDRRKNHTNIRTESVRPLCYSITQKQLYQLSAKAFREFAGKGGAAVIADVLECSAATAKNYLDARNVPSGLLDLRACHAIPQYAAMKREIAAMEMTMDPRLQAKLVEFAKMAAQYGHDLFAAEEATQP